MTASASLGEPPCSADVRLAELIDELTARLQACEPFDFDACLHEHPEHAERLEKLLPALRLLANASRPGDTGMVPGAINDTSSPSFLGELGDFRLVREIGRGAMGIVYEAEQISLNRPVALKVLPFAATLDPKQLQRFKNEAQAAAQLHHTNIVPVYYVGCERGVHFYAMQFVEGRNLAEAIAELRGQADGERTIQQPSPRSPSPLVERTVDAAAGRPIESPLPTSELRDTGPIGAPATALSTKDAAYFRTVARFGIQAAEALDHAHQHGIVHRDIKPANLLVDATDRLWVTDFGLAQVQCDTRLTMTGDLVGTLRYMSPEQALAKRIVIDHRTDVYSLGATLYELLTLEPAFTGRDRQELLRQIAFEEPRSPRRIDRAIPLELETIVGKAMEKNPADRYATAQELADDLEHFLKDEPIRAKRPTLVLRARKWGRRHRAAVWAMAAVAGLAGLMVSGNWLWTIQQDAKRHGAITADLDRAVSLQRDERWSESKLAVSRAEALLTASDPVELRLRVDEVRAALDLVTKLEEIRLEATKVKDWAYDWAGANKAYRKVFRQHGLDLDAHDPSESAARLQTSTIHAALVAALDDWVMVKWRAGLPGWEGLLAIARKADADPWRDRLRQAFQNRDKKALAELAGDKTLLDQPPTTVLLLAEALASLEDFSTAVAVLRPAQLRKPDDFWINYELGRCLRRLKPPRVEEAVGFLRVALALRKNSPGAYVSLGLALNELTHDGDQDRIAETIAIYEAGLRVKPDYAITHNDLGAVLCDHGRFREAESAFREAIRLKSDYHNAWSNLGQALTRQEKFSEGEAAFRRSLELDSSAPNAYNGLGQALHGLRRFPVAEAAFREAIRLRQDHYHAHFNLGKTLAAQHRLAEAEVEFGEAIRQKPEYVSDLNNLATVLMDQGKLVDAEKLLRQAIRFRKDYAPAHFNLGSVLWRQHKAEEAEASLQEAIRLKPDYTKARAGLGVALCARGLLADGETEFRKSLQLQPGYPLAQFCLIRVLVDQGKLREAEAAIREATAYLQTLARSSTQHLEYRNGLGESHAILGNAYARAGKFAKVVTHLGLAVEFVPDNAKLLNQLAWLLATCPEMALRDPPRAVELARKAVNLAPRIGDCWNTLGVAEYRAMHWKAAVLAFEKSMEIRKGGDGFDWFFLAMAHWQLGEKAQARKLYDEAIQWMEKNKPQDEELQRFRAEAATLLGVDDQSRPKAKEELHALPPSY
jgi:serine/threonine protein kinase/Flp pilus assembly protein TadD